ncbi:MAG TPA: tyrosine--tRNA ligase [Anaerolineales bacterium]|nr:tyrosine--tRNA ligase [Anaerolineales bacterium]
MLPVKEQVEILMQGTDFGDDGLANAMRRELTERLAEGRPLRVYCGYDPTFTDLHLGHTISMRKLRQFQDLGHEVTFLIGNYTALVGDPSDKNKARPVLTQETVEQYATTFKEQAFKVLDPAKTIVRENKEWLSQLELKDLIQLGMNFTIQQFLVRDNFSKRFDVGDPIYLHETFYALMQGYDAVAMHTDVQVGGRDQLFNIVVAGRKLQESFGQKPQIAIINGILPGTDGVARMSKSMGNHIAINTTAEDMYGKIMSLPDSAITVYSQLATRFTPAETAVLQARLASGENPRNVKMDLAFEITAIFYGESGAQAGQTYFQTVFQKGALPDDMPSVTLQQTMALVELMVQENLAASLSEARRLVQQGGVRLAGEKVENANLQLEPNGEQILQVGKRKFIRIVGG